MQSPLGLCLGFIKEMLPSWLRNSPLYIWKSLPPYLGKNSPLLRLPSAGLEDRDEEGGGGGDISPSLGGGRGGGARAPNV